MNPMGIGILVAAVLAGPRLYGMVESGELTGTGALLRGGAVAIACIAGVSFIMSLAKGYAEERRRHHAIEALTAAIEAAHAEKDTAAAGSSTASAPPAPPAPPVPPVPAPPVPAPPVPAPHDTTSP
ncbi:hypothetical protein ACIB24_02305 [Spongisporangium articulatum]|uniref:Uncharacterized protein n=1 Tax=Spongisporangium articulatum TaxID=3362603 RepID=A0ABW8AJX5_9ACTN